jgi:hypothetical protein
MNPFVTGGMEACCVKQGVADEGKLHKKNVIVKINLACLSIGNRVDVLF